MDYAFRDGTHRSGDPQTIVAELETIAAKHGRLTAEAVVIEASQPDHELHQYFDWDDSTAAHKYRLEQARELIRCIVQVVPDSDLRPRAFHMTVTASDDKPLRSYTPLMEVLADADLTAQVITEVRARLIGLRIKLDGLQQAGSLVNAIKAAEEAATAVLDSTPGVSAAKVSPSRSAGRVTVVLQ